MAYGCHIYLKQLIKKIIEFKPLLLCFVDLKQAFDKVRLRNILRSMQRYNICEKYVKIIAEMNKNNIARIKAGNTLTEASTDNHGYMARK